MTFVAVRRPGKAQPPPGKNRRLGAGCPLPGGAALAPAYVSVTFVAVRRPGKAQPPPGKTGARRRMPIAGRRCACTGLPFRDICRSATGECVQLTNPPPRPRMRNIS
ncbi:hypothetical protein IE979_31180 [Klebsiella pneumoniae]|uniref:Uncharacterized protein n=1 Tax=Klebsiella pneumoniae TaxID=573 RepID=A0A927DQ58_KLEPN|nr:hypothetical protein [Klebsiella pneumoniae]